MVRVLKILSIALAFGLTIYITSYVTSYVAGLPESNCVTAPMSESWSADRVFKATVLKKECNSGESRFYSVRFDNGKWFLVTNIENDNEYSLPPTPPVIRWVAPERLEITMLTTALKGSLERRLDGFTIIRIFQPAHEDGRG